MTNPPNPSELLPCPFCGNNLEVLDHTAEHAYHKHNGCFLDCNFFKITDWNSRHSPKGSEKKDQDI